MATSIFHALNDKARRQGGPRRKGGKTKNYFRFLLERLGATASDDISPENLVQAFNEIAIGASDSQLSRQLTQFVESSLDAGMKLPAEQRLAMLISLAVDRMGSLRRNPISAVFVCIDDLSELPPRQRNLLTDFLLREFIMKSNQTIRFRLAFYPTKTFSPFRWEQKFIVPVGIDPHEELPPPSGDPIEDRDRLYRPAYELTQLMIHG